MAKPTAKPKPKTKVAGGPKQQKPASENSVAGSSKTKTAPKKTATNWFNKCRKMEIELATMRGAKEERRSGAGVAATQAAASRGPSPTSPATPPVTMSPSQPPPPSPAPVSLLPQAPGVAQLVNRPADGPSALVPQSSLLQQIAKGLRSLQTQQAELSAKLQVALMAGQQPATA